MFVVIVVVKRFVRKGIPAEHRPMVCCLAVDNYYILMQFIAYILYQWYCIM